jgi:hypothetical protein
VSTVQVDTAGDLVLVHIPGRDEAVCMDTDEAIALVVALTEAVPDLRDVLEDTVRRMTPSRPKRRVR